MVVEIMFGLCYVMWFGWGLELIYFYNDVYVEMMFGVKYFWVFG